MDLSGAVVMVTGASSGIGKATAIAASRADARVALLARRDDRVIAIAAGLPDAIGIRCDVNDRDQVVAAVRTTLDAYGRIDALVNNAGRGLEAPVDAIDLADFRAILDLNLVAPLGVMQAVLPTMRQQGSGTIVNVGSGVTFGAVPGSGAYAASKAGLTQLGAVARAELAESGIVVSTVFPSLTKTDFFRSTLGPPAPEAEDLEGAQTPEEVAAVILDLMRSGAATADLVPIEFGGTYKS